MLITSIISIINFIIVLLISILIHEMGHLFILREYSPKAKIHIIFKSWKNFYIQTGKRKDYMFLTSKQRIKVYSMGVIPGILIIFLFSFTNEFYLLTIVPYLFGCDSDIINIFREVKYVNSKN